MKCGLEVHQRLSTAKKLFCECENGLAEIAPAGSVERTMRAVVGESGLIDPAAAFEASKNKRFEYQFFERNSCLIELDEEPPRQINQQALEMALSVSKALNAKIVDEVYVMRKQVVDGSATSGFQRTALIATNGVLETTLGKVGIPTICVEEESSGIVEKGEKTVYRLDRLGIPLIEIATDASIKTGAQAREVAEKIGLLLRASGFASRGIGSIRQDVNVSIEGGSRVEIKGAQELNDVRELVENEARRQEHLKKLKGTGIAINKFSTRSVTQTFNHLTSPFIKKAIEQGKVAMAARVQNAGHKLGQEIWPGHRLGTEASDYAKSKTGVKGIIHSDEDPAKYGASKSEWLALSDLLECGEKDAWIACVEEETLAVNALSAAHEKLAAYNTGVPNETRRSEGAISRYMRPLPGSSRMYPETDVMPVKITEEMLSKIKKPESFEDKVKRFEALGLSKDLAEKTARSAESNLFEKLAKKTEATLVSVTLLETVKSLNRDGFNPNPKQIEDALLLYSQKQLAKPAIAEALKCMSQGKTYVHLKMVTGQELKKLAEKYSAKNVDSKGAFSAIMRDCRLLVDANELKEVLK